MKSLGWVCVAAAIVVLAPTATRADDGLERATMRLVENQAPIDINSAGEDQLRTLPGIGPARAQAIVAGRPYSGKDDLVKRNILPKNVYDGVKDRIVARQK